MPAASNARAIAPVAARSNELARSVGWPGKAVVTLSDALAAVPRWLWAVRVFPQAEGPAADETLPPFLQEIVRWDLAPAAETASVALTKCRKFERNPKNLRPLWALIFVSFKGDSVGRVGNAAKR
jgi:hypothetical protein